MWHLTPEEKFLPWLVQPQISCLKCKRANHCIIQSKSQYICMIAMIIIYHHACIVVIYNGSIDKKKSKLCVAIGSSQNKYFLNQLFWKSRKKDDISEHESWTHYWSNYQGNSEPTKENGQQENLKFLTDFLTACF